MTDAQARLAEAEVRFLEVQEKLRAFIEEHLECTITGLEFVHEPSCDRLARELAAVGDAGK
jgi:hypothetical protein